MSDSEVCAGHRTDELADRLDVEVVRARRLRESGDDITWARFWAVVHIAAEALGVVVER